MSRTLVIALALVLCGAPLACSDATVPGPSGQNDAAAIVDAAARDAQPATDVPPAPLDASEPVDSGAGQPDADPLDAQPLPDADPPADSGEVIADAGEPPPDGGTSNPSCGLIGRVCSGGNECGGGGGSGLDCVDPPGLCMPIMPTCGGFVMAQCPGLTPVCLYYRGADYGPCLTVDQRNCICNDPNARQYFPGC